MQEVAYPTVQVQLEDGENVSVPWGACCLACRSACRKGIPFRDVDNFIVPTCKKDPHFKGIVVQICDIDAGRADAEVFELDQAVDTVEDHGDEIIANFDGFTADQFMATNGNDVHPAAAGLPSKVIQHPFTGEDVEVFWKESVPAFSWKFSMKKSASLRTNRMPERIYASQPKATFDHWKVNLDGENESMAQPPSHMAVTQSVEMQKKRSVPVPGKSQAPVTLPSNPGMTARPQGQGSPSGGSATLGAQSSAPKGVPCPAPTQAGKSGTARHLPRVLTPQEIKSLQVSAPMKKNVIPGHVGQGLRQVSSPSGSQAQKLLAFPSPASTVTARTRSAASLGCLVASSARSPDSKRPRLTSQALSSLGGVDSAVFHNLSDSAFRRGQAADAVSVVASVASSSAALKDVPKHRRALVDKPLSKYFGGAPTASDITKMKRARTCAVADKAEENADFIGAHIKAVSCASQLNFPELNDIDCDEVATLADVLCGDGPEGGPKGLCKEEGLPKRNFAEMAMRFGIQHLPPKKMAFTFQDFLHHAALSKDGEPVDIDHKVPVLYSKAFNEGELASGIPAQAFTEVLGAYVITPMLAKQENKSILVSCLVELLKYINGLANKDAKFGSESPCLSLFRSQLSGLVYTLADIPFVANANIKGVEVIDKGTDKFSMAIKAKGSITGTESGLMNRAWMWSMGEGKRWKDILDTSTKLRSDQESESAEGIQIALEKYTLWSTQVRPSALPLTLNNDLVDAFSKQMKKHEDESGKLDESPENDHLQTILSQVQACCTLFTDIRVIRLKQRLQSFSGKLNAMKSLIIFVELMDELVKFDQFEDQEALNAMLDKLKDSIPKVPECIAIRDEDRQVTVFKGVERIMDHALPLWHSVNSKFYDIATSFKSQVEFMDMNSKSDDARAMYASVNHKIVLFTSLYSLRLAETTYVSLGAEPQGRFTATGSLEAIKELDVCLKSAKDTVDHKCKEFADIVKGDRWSQLTKVTDANISHYKTAYTNLALEPLSSELKDLNDIAGGVSGGKKWKDYLPKPKGSGEGAMISWTQLRDGTVDTLQKLNKSVLSDRMKLTCQALASIVS